MALFSNSDDADEAAFKNISAAQTGFKQTGDVLNQYGGNALGALGTGLQTATGQLTGNMQSAIDAYRAGTGAATGYGEKAVAAYNPLSALGDQYGGAVKTYYDALGIGGPGGAERAQSAFTSSPGYQFQVDEATKAAANRAASLGIAGSGNTLDEIRNRAQGFAKQDYSSWMDRLGAFAPLQLNAATTAAGGQAAGYKTLADIAGTGAANVGGAYANLGQGLAGLTSAESQNRANVFGNIAQGQLGSVRDLTGATMQANNLVAQAGMQDNANYWGAINAGIGAVGNVLKPTPGLPKAV